MYFLIYLKTTLLGMVVTCFPVMAIHGRTQILKIILWTQVLILLEAIS